jgi:hypothetical protein
MQSEGRRLRPGALFSVRVGQTFAGFGESDKGSALVRAVLWIRGDTERPKGALASASALFIRAPMQLGVPFLFLRCGKLPIPAGQLFTFCELGQWPILLSGL